MYSQGLQHFTNIPLVIVGMLLFFLTFLAVLIRIVKKDSKYFEAANLPLNDEGSSHEGR